MQEFFQMLQYLVVTHSTDHVQMVNKSTVISGSLMDHVHIKKALLEELFTNATVENIYF